MRGWITGTALFLTSLTWLTCQLRASEADDAEFFEKKIRPVLANSCYSCHAEGAKKLKANLRVDSRENVLKGGDTGPAIVLGKPEKSLIIEAIEYKNPDMQMPPKAKLTEAQIADLKEWVKRGAPWPGATAAATTSSTGIEAFDLEKRKAKHWAWKQIEAQTPPAVKDSAWVQSPIDNFVLAKLEAANLKPAPAADKRSLLRRAYFQITGLPPTPEQTEAFMKDTAPDAYAKVIDQLLASPRFGEHWARHWLDLARYAESRGHEFDFTAPNAYQYRDYVIRAFNADVPYNQFVKEQIAGDLLPNPRRNPEKGFNESVIGTGFWYLGEMIHSPVDIRLDECERFDNMVDVMSKTFLGLTVSCARCHDHKFDAIPTKDYYRMYGFFKSSRYHLVRFDTMDKEKEISAELTKFRAENSRAVAQSMARELRTNLESLEPYLLAARDTYATAKANGWLEPKKKDAEPYKGGEYPAEVQAMIAEKARAAQLDPKRLAAWTAYLARAERQGCDPFHVWAKLAGDKIDVSKIAGTLNAFCSDHERREAASMEGVKNSELIIDYSAVKPGQWITDGVGFGAEPKKAGDLTWGTDPKQPVVGINDLGAGEFDPVWNVLKPGPNTEVDSVRMSYDRASRTLCTPSFEIKNNWVYFLSRGTGIAYHNVDSHLLINGPLHGQLIIQMNPKDRDAWQWYAFKATDYIGQRAHVEFTATSPDFAVAVVAQGEKQPGAAPCRAGGLVQMLHGPQASFQTLAQTYKTAFLNAATGLESGTLTSANAGLADWLVSHPELLGTKTPKDLQSVMEAQAKITSKIQPESRMAMAMADLTPEDDYVMIRGSWKKKGETAPRAFLEAVAGANQPALQGSGRLELAERMVAPNDPFVPRVMANRIWHFLFGRGIVRTTDNFGELGERPTHPELLDYISTRFVSQGWSIKKLIKELMLTSTFQMSTQKSPEATVNDANNNLFSRMNYRRLEGESIRDSLLAISGRLNPEMYGPAVPIKLTEQMQGRGRPGDGPLDGNNRRSIYLSIRRNFLSPMMMAFDRPIPFSAMGRRSQSNVPAQALILMNDPLVQLQASHWAKQVLTISPEFDKRVQSMYLTAFARQATEAELNAAKEFIATQSKDLEVKDANDPRPWTDFAHVLINTKEFIFLD